MEYEGIDTTVFRFTQLSDTSSSPTDGGIELNVAKIGSKTVLYFPYEDDRIALSASLE